MGPGVFASFVDMLGERMCTALNDTVIYDSDAPIIPNGYLIASNSDRFATSTGDLLVYVEKN